MGEGMTPCSLSLEPELETGQAFRVGFGFKFQNIFWPISGPYVKLFHCKLIKSKDLFQLGNRFFFVARENITVYYSAFNHSG